MPAKIIRKKTKKVNKKTTKQLRQQRGLAGLTFKVPKGTRIVIDSGTEWSVPDREAEDMLDC